jgi:hypothetical protein
MEELLPGEVVDLSEPDFSLVPTIYVAALWHQIQPILMEFGKKWLETYSLEEVCQSLTTGYMDVWIAGEDGVAEGVTLCAWECHAHKKFYHILFCGGRGLEKYFDGLEKIEQYVCMSGGAEVLLEGRLGWGRRLKKHGYSQTTVKLRKPVSVLWRS